MHPISLANLTINATIFTSLIVKNYRKSPTAKGTSFFRINSAILPYSTNAGMKCSTNFRELQHTTAKYFFSWAQAQREKSVRKKIFWTIFSVSACEILKQRPFSYT